MWEIWPWQFLLTVFQEIDSWRYFWGILLHSMVAGCNNGRNNPPLAGKDYLTHIHYDCTDTTWIKGLEKKSVDCNELSGCHRHVKASSATYCHMPVHFFVRFSFVDVIKHSSSVRFHSFRNHTFWNCDHFKQETRWSSLSRVSKAIERTTFKHILDQLVQNNSYQSTTGLNGCLLC